MKYRLRNLLTALFVLALGACSHPTGKELYVYKLHKAADISNEQYYDQATLVASIEGLINRDGPKMYLLSEQDTLSGYWLRLFTREGEWMADFDQKELSSLDELFKLGRSKIKGAVVWDPTVPATVNVATTIAGVEDRVIMSPWLADKYLAKWKITDVVDLRGKFTGTETGSAKNDAYRWAIREYLDKGVCNGHRLSLYQDSWEARPQGNIGFAIAKDWAVMKCSFAYDLAPWDDILPKDDPGQPLGTDLATHRMILDAVYRQTAGLEMTEIAGFVAFNKYSTDTPSQFGKHDPVPSEWQLVYLVTPYNCYLNTYPNDCFNQSLHSQAPFKPLKQNRPSKTLEPAGKNYVCILMADYDSALALYYWIPLIWENDARGKLPCIWGVNPNLIETYPDIVEYLYRTASENDYFGADASAAGYMNPNEVPARHLPLFVKHNKKYYEALDMTISPMILDFDQPSAQVKDAFAQFSPDGFATNVMDLHYDGGRNPETHVWKGMPVLEFKNRACDFFSVEQMASSMSAEMSEARAGENSFTLFRTTATQPDKIIESLELLRKKRPELDIEVVDPYNFFNLVKMVYGEK